MLDVVDSFSSLTRIDTCVECTYKIFLSMGKISSMWQSLFVGPNRMSTANSLTTPSHVCIHEVSNFMIKVTAVLYIDRLFLGCLTLGRKMVFNENI